jgi:ubiquinone/menaquinone biosynthesis C-methylase UbiE
MKNNYDRVVEFYDLLGKVVFGDALMRAQRSVLHFIPQQAKVLIIGGGTGEILEEITRLHAKGINIIFIEISKKMIDKAAQRNIGSNEVRFVHNAIEDYGTGERFDVIITSFLFDNFKQEKAELVFKKLDNLLLPDGKWLFTDFDIDQNLSGSWQKWLLKSMYLFFKIFSNVEANKLPNMASLFDNAGYQQIFQKFHFRRFINSAVFQKR